MGEGEEGEEDSEERPIVDEGRGRPRAKLDKEEAWGNDTNAGSEEAEKV